MVNILVKIPLEGEILNALSPKELDKDYDGAIEDYNRALESNPNESINYFCRARLIYRYENDIRKPDYEGAIKDFSKSIELNPKEWIAYYFRAFVMFHKYKDYKSAIEDCNNTIIHNPEYYLAYILRAQIKDRIKDYRGAIEDYTTALEMEPNNINLFKSRSEIKEKLGDYLGSFEDKRKAMPLDPKDARYYYCEGWIKYYQGNYREAIENFTLALRADSQFTASIIARGVTKIANGKFDEALQDLHIALELNPDCEVALGLGDKLKLWLQSKFNNGETFLVALPLGNNFDQLNFHIDNAKYLYNEGKYQKSFSHLEIVFKTGYFSPAFLEQIGDVKFRLKKYNEACDYYGASIDLGLTDPSNNLNKRTLAKRHMSFFKRTERDIPFKEYDPFSWKTLHSLNQVESAHDCKCIGDARYDLGFYTEAVEFYSKALELEPDYSDAIKARERAEEKLNDHPGA
ncbi:hypothetical protein [Telluribacter sp.]|jgi:tetratricopeptide (TPR) repeat protein|uniref:tetratricopeptide repeat protein n=1 Tax=Telluribacter sp. TaxID=1978767 RepID=UPI002E1531B9|nr:hypothetical protein [Telluribacter sp.]